MISYSFFVLCTVLAVVSSRSSSSSSSVKDSFDFLKNAQNKFKVTNHRDIIIVVGNTDSGKSTLVHYVAGDMSKLCAIPSSNLNNSDYEIRDDLDPLKGAQISTNEPRTFVPEMVIDEQSNVWYDCPSFSENRNKTAKIANAVFIKRIIDSATNIKFVLVVNAESMTKSRNHFDLDKLLDSTTELIKNITNYSESLSMVVTKVPPHYAINLMVSEESVKNTTAEYLIEHRTALEGRGSLINSEKILAINALLAIDSNNNYKKIAIFWKPPQLGNFNDIDLLKKGRILIRETILNTSYSPKQSTDFSFQLSAEVILHIMGMVKQAVDARTITLKDIHNRVQHGVNQTIQSTQDIKRKLNLINNGQSKIEYCSSTNAFNLNNITGLYRDMIKDNGLQTIQADELNQILDEDSYMNELKSLDSDIDAMISIYSGGDYKSLFDQMGYFYQKCVADFEYQIQIQTQQIMDNILIALKNIDQQILAALQAVLGNSGCYQNKLTILNECKKTIASGNVVTFDQKIKQFVDLIQNLNLTSINIGACNQTQMDHLSLIDLVNLSKSKLITIPYANWILDSSKAINFISTEHDWYSFLSDVYKFLASYQVQKDVRAYNVRDLSNWGNSGAPQGLLITDANFKDFIQHHSFNNLVNFSPTPTKIKELNEIIDVTVKSQMKQQCYNQIATIEGHFVKSSDIEFTNCQGYSRQGTKKITVFATDTFFVDSNVNLNGMENVELHIFANKWNILQPVTFYLNGIDGTSHAPLTTNGTAGKAGISGTNSGNFFGVANEVISGELLTIEVIGGNGSNGQSGTGNQDLNIKWDKLGNNIVYSPHEWYSDLIQFQSGAKIVTVTENSCEERMRDTFPLLQENVFYTHILFPTECCGATGKGGAAGLGGAFGYAEFHHLTNRGLPPNINKSNGKQGLLGENAVTCKTSGIKHTTNGEFEGFGTACEHVYVGDGTNDKLESIPDTSCPDDYVTSTDVVRIPSKPLTLLKSVELREYRGFLADMSKYAIFEKIIKDLTDAIAHI
ncbi:uncharacterized protein LOC116345903 [Contarinia nasturtii]|uniref:uncharacterized protein LOC116345903 n=1 Tax=Contarinia nasturtii TaxID=265458 RepID=UPI0012D42938|nr:uncharacterized protein LOC116345903 [Contarinia nasturtii]